MSTLPIGRQPRFHIILPLVLIVFGLVLLLVEVGAVSADAVGRLVMLWPLLLVMLGIEIIIERTRPDAAGRVLAAVLIGLVAVLGFAWAFAGGNLGFAGVKGDLTGPAATGGNSSLVVNAGGVRLNLAAGAPGDPLYRVSYDVHGSAPEVSGDGRGTTISTGQNNWSPWANGSDRLDIALNPDTDWAFQVNAGAATSRIDLTRLNAGSLRLNAGAGSTNIRLGQPSGTVPIDIRGGAMSVTVEVPAGVQVRVVSTGALTSFSGPDGATGGGWSTTEYASSADRYEVTIEAAASSVRVVRLA